MGKEEIIHSGSEVVSTFSQLSSPVTTQNAGKIDFMVGFFFLPFPGDAHHYNCGGVERDKASKHSKIRLHSPCIQFS